MSEGHAHEDLLRAAHRELQALRARVAAGERHGQPIAVIGMSCRFPGAATPEEFWELLRDGRDAIGEVPAERWDAAALDLAAEGEGCGAARRGAFIAGVDLFDAEFFGISPREAASMDPQQRLLLEIAWEALERAGYAPDRLAGEPVAVFVGIGAVDYSRRQARLAAGQGLQAAAASYLGTGTALSIAANRISYVLGLEGPSVALDTACSSSLVAVHLACQSLRSGESRMALAGGVNLMLSPDSTLFYSRAAMLSPDGRCKTFDAAADGYVRGEGCGLVVLKPLAAALADGDPVLAVIRASAVNQDGRSGGLTAPSELAQRRLLRTVLRQAGVEPAAVDYVEAHGTGTRLGDPIEVEALGAVLGLGRLPDQPLWLGSAKTNIGHLEMAAGIAGLIKTVLALGHELIPPHLNLHRLNPLLRLDRIPARVATAPVPWRRGGRPRIAGVSSFGFGGTNAHVLLAEAPGAAAAGPLPAAPPAAGEEPGRPLALFPLAARSAAALRQLAGRHAAAVAGSAEPLADLSWTAQAGRSRFPHRLAVTAGSPAALAQRLAAFAAGQEPPGTQTAEVPPEGPPRLAFLFSGQGSQAPGMGRGLYLEEPVFRAVLDRCSDLLRGELPRPLLEVLFPEPGVDSPLTETVYAQPALFALQMALAAQWRAWGVRPAAVFGHSSGEYAAACLAGVFTLEQGLALVAERGRLMQALPRRGAMAAVFAGEELAAAAIAPFPDELAIAAVNGPSHVVVSGDERALAEVLAGLAARQVRSKPLAVSHAFHSPLMEAVLPPFARRLGEAQLGVPVVPLVRDLDGAWAGAEMASADYWCRQLRWPVRFADGLATLREKGCELLIEVGPAPVLLGLAGRHWPGGKVALLPSLRPGRGDLEQLLESLGGLYVRGCEPDWEGFQGSAAGASPRRRVALPTYPWERQSYPLDGAAAAPPFAAAAEPPAAAAADELRERLAAAPAAERGELLAALAHREVAKVLRLDPDRPLDRRAGLVVLGFDSLTGIELRNRLERALGLAPATLPATLIFDFPTLDAIAGALVACALGAVSAGPPPAPAGDAAAASVAAAAAEARAVAAVAGLGDAEVEALLLARLQEI